VVELEPTLPIGTGLVVEPRVSTATRELVGFEAHKSNDDKKETGMSHSAAKRKSSSRPLLGQRGRVCDMKVGKD
jgi:hypothetical protein